MTLTAVQARRWSQVLDTLVAMLPPAARVVVDGAGGHSALLADRVAAALHSAGRGCVRLAEAHLLAGTGPLTSTDPLTGTGPICDADPSPDAGAVVLADGPRWRARSPAGAWDVVIWLRVEASQAPGEAAAGACKDGHACQEGHACQGSDSDGEHGADVVIDLRDPAWPVIRRVADRLAGHRHWYLAESRAFFGARAETWDAKFGHDIPSYAKAISDAHFPAGGVVVDVGCGTGRALPALRAAVGGGTVIGVDHTPQMLDVARAEGRADDATLLLADASQLPLADASVDAVFAAGLIMHLPDAAAGLAEFARVTRDGGRLAVFHPSSRAALAARHGRTVRPDDLLSEGPLRALTRRAGWRLDSYGDAPDHFLALATHA